MYIKLKNGKQGHAFSHTALRDAQCDWCSKTIKKYKNKFLQDGFSNGTCCMAHAKAFMNAKA